VLFFQYSTDVFAIDAIDVGKLIWRSLSRFWTSYHTFISSPSAPAN